MRLDSRSKREQVLTQLCKGGLSNDIIFIFTEFLRIYELAGWSEIYITARIGSNKEDTEEEESDWVIM